MEGPVHSATRGCSTITGAQHPVLVAVLELWLKQAVCANVTEDIQVQMMESVYCVLLVNSRLKWDRKNALNAPEILGVIR
jgi:hypothetical protein